MSDAVTVDRLLDGRLLIFQPKEGHRAGTDSALLAACVPESARGDVLDLGAGAGSVGLSVAMRAKGCRVALVEIDADVAALAARGVEANGLGDRVSVVRADILVPSQRRDAALRPEAADIVVTNPPYHLAGTVRASPSSYRRGAHALAPGEDDAWIRASAALLRPRGVLALVHRADALGRLLASLESRFGDVRVKAVHPREGEAATRILVRAVKASRSPLVLTAPLVLHGANGAFTTEADALHKGRATIDWGLETNEPRRGGA